ncbi:MAG: metallophosphatase family protein [Anaerolineae bacterium]|nr:metallophosphatase family protein [Anaerolineae bacterium]
MMRVAIFSDVHGNYPALEAILADIDAKGPFDHIVFAGDLVLGAADPAKCIAALQTRGIAAIYGNTDELLWQLPPLDDETPEEKAAFLNLVAWTQTQIGESGLAYLRGLPFELRFSPSSDDTHDLLIVHANPVNIHSPIYPPEELQTALFGKIHQPDSAVEPLLKGVTAEVMAYGHVHVPSIRKIGRHTLVNIASVARPSDGDWRAKYGILTFEEGVWHPQHRYVEYDVAAARAAILAAEMPRADDALRRTPLPTT